MSRPSRVRPRLKGLAVTVGLVALTLSVPSAALAAGPDAPAGASSQSAAPEAGLDLDQQPVQAADLNAATARPSLERGQTLAPGDSVASSSAQWMLHMNPEGDLSIQKAPNRLNPEPYAVGLLSGVPGSRLVFQGDGNIVLYGPDDSVQDAFGTGGTQATSLSVQYDGAVVLMNGMTVVAALNDSDALFNGGTLLPGESLTTPNGRSVLVMQTDGNLVLYQDHAVRFASGLAIPGSGAVLQMDSNFVVYSPTNIPLFTTRTSSLALFDVLGLDDSEFRVIYVEQDGIEVGFGSLWGSDAVQSGSMLLPGDRRTGGNGYSLVFQTDGNLVEYLNGRAIFATRTAADFAVMQPDGNFVVYGASCAECPPRGVFTTGTAGNPGSRLVVQRDGNLVVYTSANRPVFALRR